MLLLLGSSPLAVMGYESNKGDVGNLVCFVRFADEEASEVFTGGFDKYEQLFNAGDESSNSVYNYFRKASYGQLSWKSSFFPASSDGKIVSYQAQYKRGFYQEKSDDNTDGYEDETEMGARRMALVKEIAQYLADNLTDDIVVDVNGDGMVDNLCIVLSGESGLSAKKLLWPQRVDLALPDEKAVYIKGKKLVGYLMVFDEANGFDSSFKGIALNTGVLCHEMSHSLGTYDLYHVSDKLNPVGVWDLMSDNQFMAQNMTAYTKWRYCKWIDEIPEITEEGTYTLNPIGGDDTSNLAYKIQPVASDEYFIVEYRQKEGFDASLPSSGMIVYRINPSYSGGNVNYNGTTRLDEQYIFRPGGSVSADGNLSQAALSADNGRTAFGGDAEIKPFYSDGTEAPFSLSEISACGDQITFRLDKMPSQLVVSDSVVRLKGEESSASTITIASDAKWSAASDASWINISPSAGEHGKTSVVISATSKNEEFKSREAVVVITAESGLSSSVRVVQASGLVDAPDGVTAEDNDGKVVLSWNANQSLSTLVTDDFENTENPVGWTIESAGYRGWTWKQGTAGKGFYRPYAGNYAITVEEAWEEKHQDESLISPVVADATMLSFYSRTNAAGRTPKDPQEYNVDVSSDGGQSWTTIFNARTDCPDSLSGKYALIELDLSAYKSSEMKVRFRCYDTNNLGLSYYWQIDDVNIYGASSEYQVTGYNIYRNGELIGSTSDTSFTDESPIAGENSYTICAVGTFGESSESDAVSVDMTYLGISAVRTDGGDDGRYYNAAGQKVDGGYKGIVIRQGKKYLAK